jgi:hypothetical protein
MMHLLDIKVRLIQVFISWLWIWNDGSIEDSRNVLSNSHVYARRKHRQASARDSSRVHVLRHIKLDNFLHVPS